MLRSPLVALLLPSVIACGAEAPSSAGYPEVHPPAVPAVDPVPLVAEAGFIDVPSTIDASHEARIFTVFQPADDDPARKPLVVFWNGGPGFPTTLGLLSYGTGRYTLDADGDGTAPHLNDARWTRFANVLYVDQRGSGFSYERSKSPTKAARETCSFSEVGDAIDFTRATLRFLAAHPAIEGNRVVLAGESYGGMRATWMLDLLLHYTTAIPAGDAPLRDEIQAHWDRVWPDLAGTDAPPARIASQFGRQVLIEPLVAGKEQYDTQRDLIARDPAFENVDGVDGYDIRKPLGWSTSLDDRAGVALVDPDGFTKLVGVSWARIPELFPAGRTFAFRRDGSAASAPFNAISKALTGELGALPEGDASTRSAHVRRIPKRTSPPRRSSSLTSATCARSSPTRDGTPPSTPQPSPKRFVAAASRSRRTTRPDRAWPAPGGSAWIYRPERKGAPSPPK